VAFDHYATIQLRNSIRGAMKAATRRLLIMSDRIEKSIDLRAPVERVWRALTDADQFGQWFRVTLDAPFAVGQTTRGHVTIPGYEHLLWAATVTAMEPPRRFAFTWHPYAIDPKVDYSAEPPTLVEFAIEPLGEGARLTVVESGFDALPAERREIALRMNDGGWAQQMLNIKAHVET
jgi:uncharacterized protein YndB with AHSA1/START domain